MPDRSGLDILRHVRSGHPGTKVLVLSGYPERQYALNVLRAGASGYIAKDSEPEALLRAVRVVLQGRRYVSESLAELLLLDLDRADKPLHSLLSDREFQIFGKLAAGQGVIGDRPRVVPVREDREHLPDTHPREDANEEQCGPYQLCITKRHHPVVAPTRMAR